MTLPTPKKIIEAIVTVQYFVESHIAKAGPAAFVPLHWIAAGDRLKPLTPVDQSAEVQFESAMYEIFGDATKLNFLGEERLHSDTDLSKETRLCCLVDMIDGTDLLERGFGNWCSAILLFDPEKVLIEFASVVVPNTRAYYADRNGAFFFDLKQQDKAPPKPTGSVQRLTINNNSKTLKDASVCMYAQKTTNLLTLLSLDERADLTQWLKQQKEAGDAAAAMHEELKFRFYNLAGNPMMARIPEGAVDIVFDVVGQHPHDVVPGAFIALKAGACLATPTGEEIDEKQLTSWLRRPGLSRERYIVAATKGLKDEFVRILDETKIRIPEKRAIAHPMTIADGDSQTVKAPDLCTWDEVFEEAQWVGDEIFNKFHADVVLTFPQRFRKVGTALA